MFPTLVDYSFVILHCEARFENQEEEIHKENQFYCLAEVMNLRDLSL